MSTRPAFRPRRSRKLPFTEPDRALVDAFERKERRAAEQLYAHLVGVVEGTLRHILGKHDEHHGDLVQSAFEQILTALSRRKFARRCGLASWASSVTAHIAFNSIRARTRERRCLDRWRDGYTGAARYSRHDDLERVLGAREELAIVGGELAEMKRTYAATLFLHDVLGHELSEVAALTGTSFAAAQSRLVRGRGDLRGRLKKRRSALRAPSASRSRPS